MTNASVALIEYLRKIGLELDQDFLQPGLQLLTQWFIEQEVTQQIGAAKHERTLSRQTQRNGYRDRTWETRVGELDLRIPKLRQGSYFPSLLEPRRRAEKALLAVVQQAYVEGVSTRKLDELVQTLGLNGIDKSRVSRICHDLDTVGQPFRERALVGVYPYVWLDALYLKVRVNHRIVSQALVIAIGVRESGEREVLGFALGASEEAAFWTEFLRGLTARGLTGVQLVIRDSHVGLKQAINQVLGGATWQRCRVHFMRNRLAHIPQADKAAVAAVVRTIFAQPDRTRASQQLAEVVERMEPRWSKAAQLLSDAEDDVLAYLSFPPEHWTRSYSTNILERLTKEVKRRTHVVGVFPDEPSVLRLGGAVLLEIADEWELERRYFSLESMHKLIDPNADLITAVSTLRMAPVRCGTE